MIAKKKRIAKKEIQEDKLVTSLYKSQEFFEKYKQQIFFAVGALAVIVLAFVWYANKVKEDNLEATKELAKMLPIYESGSYQEAIEGKPGTDVLGLKQIVENYGSTEQGEIAKVYLANSYYYLGKVDDALKYYESYSGNSNLFKAAAYAGIASCNERQGNYEEAAKYFEKAASVSKFNVQNPKYLLDSGIDYIQAQNISKAKEVFEKLKNNYKKSPLQSEVERYLASIN